MRVVIFMDRNNIIVGSTIYPSIAFEITERFNRYGIQSSLEEVVIITHDIESCLFRISVVEEHKEKALDILQSSAVGTLAPRIRHVEKSSDMLPRFL